ncbi:hypothetical protein [uncultured Clostridium sp.]|uniref:DUF4829 domain-containing protein n=2 Tax=Clostridium faecium TaxID=2762223 RepID=A0ABR8YVA8_9CLOT|nr:hypothetical protein [uncultured Clostridium sp.]MBD8047876.1 hypothetical protein [Clostridium faecium]MDU1349389.1 hypothetical protein [Clostridium argentinense]
MMSKFLKYVTSKNKKHSIICIYLSLLICIFFTLTLSSCTVKQLEGDIIEAYITIIHDIYPPKDDDLKIIALDLEEAINLSEKDKKILLEQLSKDYSSEIMLKNRKQLKEEGSVNEEGFKDGVLIRIDEVKNKLNGKGFKYSISRWHSPKGANGYNSTILYENNAWNIKKGNLWET